MIISTITITIMIQFSYWLGQAGIVHIGLGQRVLTVVCEIREKDNNKAINNNNNNNNNNDKAATTTTTTTTNNIMNNNDNNKAITNK